MDTTPRSESYIYKLHAILYGYWCPSAARNSGSGRVRKKTEPLVPPFTVTVLAWLLTFN